MMHLCRRTEDRLTSAGDAKAQLIKQQINPVSDSLDLKSGRS